MILPKIQNGPRSFPPGEIKVGMFAMASSRGTPQQRRERYLKLAAEAEIAAAKLNDPKAKEAWVELAVSWMLMASEISPENKNGRKRKPGGGTKS